MSRDATARVEQPTAGWMLLQSAWMLPAFIPSGEWTWLAYGLLPIVSGNLRYFGWLAVFAGLQLIAGPQLFGPAAPLALGVVWVFGMLLALFLNPRALRHAWTGRLLRRQARSRDRRNAEPTYARDRTVNDRVAARAHGGTPSAVDAHAARQAALASVAAVLAAAVVARTAETAAAVSRLAGSRADTERLGEAAPAPHPLPDRSVARSLEASGVPTAAPGGADLGPGISVIPQTTIYDPESTS